jgi:predicted Zn-dependent protease
MERDLRRILGQDPQNVQAMNALGFTLADHTDRYEEAEALVARALTLSPKSFYIQDSMGWVLFKRGKLKEALEYLKKAQGMQDDPEVAAHLGEVLWALDRKKEAESVWAEGLRRTPKDPKIRATMERLKK